jgi:hypothetical protein
MTGFVETSPNNSSADADGLIDVRPGNPLPVLPRNALRVRADWTHGPFALGASILAVDSQYVRGNENNADRSGKVPGNALVALDGALNITRSGSCSHASTTCSTGSIRISASWAPTISAVRVIPLTLASRVLKRSDRRVQRLPHGSVFTTVSTAAREVAKLSRPT